MYHSKRYRIIGKELCPKCLELKSLGELGLNCNNCKWFKYNNVTKLKTFFYNVVEKKFPNWVWFRVYEYVAKSNGKELKTYRNWHKQNGHLVRDIPYKEQL